MASSTSSGLPSRARASTRLMACARSVIARVPESQGHPAWVPRGTRAGASQKVPGAPQQDASIRRRHGKPGRSLGQRRRQGHGRSVSPVTPGSRQPSAWTSRQTTAPSASAAAANHRQPDLPPTRRRQHRSIPPHLPSHSCARTGLPWSKLMASENLGFPSPWRAPCRSPPRPATATSA